MKQLKITLHEKDAERFTREAERQGIPRAELLRQKVLRTGEPISIPADIYALVQRVRRKTGFGLDNRMLENIVMCVVSEVVN